MKKPLRIAVIGNGRWGKNIVKTLRTLPQCVVSYVATRDYAYLLKVDDIDAAVIATPPKTHASIALKFLAQEIPVFIEKPMTMSESEALRITAVSKKMKTPVFVGHIDLYNPAYKAVHAQVRKLGALHAVVSEGAGMGPFRSDASVLWDWAPHNCAMIFDTVGKKPTFVQALGTTHVSSSASSYDVSVIKLTFPGGCVGYIHNSRISPRKKRSLTIVGNKGTAIYSDTESEKAIVTFHPLSKKVASAPNNPPVVLPYVAISPLEAELSAFIKSVRTKKASKTDAWNGLAVVSIIEAAHLSIKKGGARVRVK